MLFNQISFQNKFILFADQYGMEKYAESLMKGILRQQNNLVKTEFLKNSKLAKENLIEIRSEIIILPLVSEILIRKEPEYLFNMINILKQNRNVKQMYLWATQSTLEQNFIIPFLEYMADQIITIKDLEKLSILIRKPGGLIVNKYFSYKITPIGFEIEPLKTSKPDKVETNNKMQDIGTFKIALEEEEMIARNALKLPYEKAKENEGNIVYTPEDMDDFDDEDPDEDLSI